MTPQERAAYIAAGYTDAQINAHLEAQAKEQAEVQRDKPNADLAAIQSGLDSVDPVAGLTSEPKLTGPHTFDVEVVSLEIKETDYGPRAIQKFTIKSSTDPNVEVGDLYCMTVNVSPGITKAQKNMAAKSLGELKHWCSLVLAQKAPELSACASGTPFLQKTMEVCEGALLRVTTKPTTTKGGYQYMARTWSGPRLSPPVTTAALPSLPGLPPPPLPRQG